MRGLRIAGDSLGGYSWERGKGGVEVWTDQSLLKLMPFPVPLYVYGESGHCGVNGERIKGNHTWGNRCTHLRSWVCVQSFPKW